MRAKEDFVFLSKPPKTFTESSESFFNLCKVLNVSPYESLKVVRLSPIFGTEGFIVEAKLPAPPLLLFERFEPLLLV